MGLIKKVYKKYFDLSYKDRSILTSKGSIIYNLSSGIIKLAAGFLFPSIFFLMSGIYSVGLSLIRIVYLMGVKKDQVKEIKYYFAMVMISFLTCILYIYNSTRVFSSPTPNYPVVVSIGIVAYGIIDLSIAIVGLLKTHKEHDLLLTGVKWVCLTSAVTSMALTQVGIVILLSYITNRSFNIYIGIGTIFFGVLNLFICWIMLNIFRKEYSYILNHSLLK